MDNTTLATIGTVGMAGMGMGLLVYAFQFFRGLGQAATMVNNPLGASGGSTAENYQSTFRIAPAAPPVATQPTSKCGLLRDWERLCEGLRASGTPEEKLREIGQEISPYIILKTPPEKPPVLEE